VTRKKKRKGEKYRHWKLEVDTLGQDETARRVEALLVPPVGGSDLRCVWVDLSDKGRGTYWFGMFWNHIRSLWWLGHASTHERLAEDELLEDSNPYWMFRLTNWCGSNILKVRHWHKATAGDGSLALVFFVSQRGKRLPKPCRDFVVLEMEPPVSGLLTDPARVEGPGWQGLLHVRRLHLGALNSRLSHLRREEMG
jgi:hypothetical protein